MHICTGSVAWARCAHAPHGRTPTVACLAGSLGRTHPAQACPPIPAAGRRARARPGGRALVRLSGCASSPACPRCCAHATCKLASCGCACPAAPELARVAARSPTRRAPRAHPPVPSPRMRRALARPPGYVCPAAAHAPLRELARPPGRTLARLAARSPAGGACNAAASVVLSGTGSGKKSCP